MYKSKTNSTIRSNGDGVRKASRVALTLIVNLSALLTSNEALASTHAHAKTHQAKLVVAERVQLRSGSAFSPVSHAVWHRPEASSPQHAVAAVNAMPSEYIYPGSVVLVLFGLALVLTSLVGVMRQRQLDKARLIAVQSNWNAKHARRQSKQSKVQSVKLPEISASEDKLVAPIPVPSCSLVATPPASARPVRINVRRQPCSLEQFTQIEHLVDVAVARMLESRFEIAPNDWELIRGFWNQQNNTQIESSSAPTNTRMPFEPASIDDYVEIQMAVTRTTKEALEKLFNLDESEWLKMKLYWYQQFPKDGALTRNYQMARAEYKFNMNREAA